MTCINKKINGVPTDFLPGFKTNSKLDQVSNIY